MFITALFIITRTWKQPRCPSADEWIRKLWYIYTLDLNPEVARVSGPSTVKQRLGDFPGGLVVKTSPSSAGGVSSTPGQGAKIPHDSQSKKQNIKN